MLKDITLGQYFPGNTIVHRLDPRTKLIAVVLYIAALFTANNWSATALVLLTLVFCVALSRIRPNVRIRSPSSSFKSSRSQRSIASATSYASSIV